MNLEKTFAVPALLSVRKEVAVRDISVYLVQGRK